MKAKQFKCDCGECFTKRGLVEHHKVCEVFKKASLERKRSVGRSSHSSKRRTGYEKSNSKEGGWNCECGQNFRTRKLLNEHKKECSIRPNLKRPHNTQYVHLNQYTKAKLLGLPVPKISEETKEKIRKSNTGRHPTEETKKKISESMRKAHAEGRSHNIGNCRWNNKPSYPEEWFMKVIKNEKLDSNYIREMPFHGFSLDFAWVDKKFCVEIDGEQHYREGEFFEKQRERDNKKDELLKEEGWTEIRVSWAWVCNNTKSFIEIVKNNLNNLKDLSINVASKQFIKTKKQLEDERALRKTEAIKNGTLASNGHLSPNKLSFEEWEKRKNLIKNSGVDLTKFGRVEKLVKITGLTKRQVENTLKHFNMFY